MKLKSQSGEWTGSQRHATHRSCDCLPGTRESARGRQPEIQGSVLYGGQWEAAGWWGITLVSWVRKQGSLVGFLGSLWGLVHIQTLLTPEV